MALSKKERTMDLYIDAAAKVKLLYDMLLDTKVALSKVLLRPDSDRLDTAEKALVYIKDVAERRMIKDHPEIEYKDFEHVFYGGAGHFGELESMVSVRMNEILDSKRITI